MTTPALMLGDGLRSSSKSFDLRSRNRVLQYMGEESRIARCDVHFVMPDGGDSKPGDLLEEMPGIRCIDQFDVCGDAIKAQWVASNAASCA